MIPEFVFNYLIECGVHPYWATKAYFKRGDVLSICFFNNVREKIIKVGYHNLKLKDYNAFIKEIREACRPDYLLYDLKMFRRRSYEWFKKRR